MRGVQSCFCYSCKHSDQYSNHACNCDIYCELREEYIELVDDNGNSLEGKKREEAIKILSRWECPDYKEVTKNANI